MSKKEKTLETTMAQNVKARYFNTMRTNPDFSQGPYLDMWWFRRHFAAVAHQHGIFHRQDAESRAQYNLYFGLVRTRLSEAIKRLEQNERDRHPPIIPAKILPEPAQLPLALPPPPIPKSFQRWYQNFKARRTAKH